MPRPPSLAWRQAMIASTLISTTPTSNQSRGLAACLIALHRNGHTHLMTPTNKHPYYHDQTRTFDMTANKTIMRIESHLQLRLLYELYQMAEAQLNPPRAARDGQPIQLS